MLVSMHDAIDALHRSLDRNGHAKETRDRTRVIDDFVDTLCDAQDGLEASRLASRQTMRRATIKEHNRKNMRDDLRERQRLANLDVASDVTDNRRLDLIN